MRLKPRTPRQFLLIAAFVLASTVLNTNSGAFAVPLEGKIEHVETMPSIEPEMMPGARFQVSVSENEPDNRWVKVPHWLIGTWTVKEETAVYRKNFRNGEENRQPYSFPVRQKFNYGHQQDNQGNVWHYLGTPYTSKAELPNFVEYHTVKSKSAQELSEQAAAFRSIVSVARVRSGIVRESYQQESITRYAPEDGFTITMAASTKSFDPTGAPLFQQDNQARIKRYAGFHRVDSEHGRNLKLLFEQFISSINPGAQRQ